MFNNDTDGDWEKFGATQPYYGVLSEERYRADNLTEEHRDEFFTSGEIYVQKALDTVKLKLDPDFRPDNVVDFGCGVGRLSIPFARTWRGISGSR